MPIRETIQRVFSIQTTKRSAWVHLFDVHAETACRKPPSSAGRGITMKRYTVSAILRVTAESEARSLRVVKHAITVGNTLDEEIELIDAEVTDQQPDDEEAPHDFA